MAVDLISSPLAPPTEVGGGREVAYRDAIRAFVDGTQALREVVDTEQLLRLAAGKMCELIGVSRCSVYLRDEDSDLFRGQVGITERGAKPEIDALVKRLTCGVEADRFTREIVRRREPVVIEDALRDPRGVRSAMRTWRVRSMMGVPMLRGDEVIGIFYLDCEDEVRHFSELDRDLSFGFAELVAAAIFEGERVRELRERNETLTRQNQALRRAAAVEERFTRLVVGGGGLREIAKAVSEMTDKPCLICDPQLRALAAASSASGSIESIGEDPALRAEIARLAVDKGAVVGPFPRDGLNVRLAVAPVTVGDERRANLLLGETGSRFSNFDLLLCRRVATIVALALSVERRASAAEWNARAALASELIRGNRDAAALERRAEFLGVALGRPRVVALLGVRAGGPQALLPDANEAVAALRRASPEREVLATGVAEGIALVLRLPADQPVATGVARLKAELESALRELDPDRNLVGGVSTRCRGIGDYVRAYEQARQVMGCIGAHGAAAATRVLSADDLGPGRLLLAGADPDEAGRFTEESIGPLLAAGAPPELLATLVCFFENGYSVRRSAAALEVHENTIRNRLARIEKLTGKDVATDSAAQLSAQIALLFLRIQGRFEQRASLQAE